jgi:hypothetical protein
MEYQQAIIVTLSCRRVAHIGRACWLFTRAARNVFVTFLRRNSHFRFVFFFLLAPALNLNKQARALDYEISHTVVSFPSL